MPLMEISIIPVGTKEPSISSYVAISEKVIQKKKGIKAQITAMGTIIEADRLGTLLRVAQKMHQKMLASGVKRVLTHITVDERIDKKASMKSKIDSLREKMGI